MKSNDAENLVEIKNGKRYYRGKLLRPSIMVWKCTVEGCTTPPKPQRRGQYENKMQCNACSNREKAKNPELLKKRGEAISKSIKSLGNKWSEVATKNMANEEIRNKISDSMTKYVSENKEKALEIRSKTALKNNKITGFGTKEFSEKYWASLSEEGKKDLGEKISEGLTKTGQEDHERLLKSRFPNFKLIEFGYPDNLYECPEKHIFLMRGNNFLKRGNCPSCTPKSQPQLDLYKWFLTISKNAKSDKRVLFLDDTENGNKALEIDIFDEDKKFGIEYHGVYYHQEDMVGNLHQTKADLADKHGIKLLQFFEDEILENLPLVQSVIKAKYGIIENSVGARKCEIVILNKDESNIFLENNHLQGKCKSFLRIGLKYNNELISMISFRKYKYDKNMVEIGRYCSKINTTINGGFSKIMSHAEKILKEMGFNKIVTYADRRYSDGSIYKNNGFSFVHFTEPDFYWVKNATRYSRQISWGKTKEEMIAEKYYKILGAGHSFWEKSI